MRVYTQPGDYRYTKNAITEEGTEGGWSTVFNRDMKLNTNRLVGIRVNEGDGVFIPQREVQSFIIYCNRGMLVAPGRQRDEGVTFSENEDLEVREGVKSKKAFSRYTVSCLYYCIVFDSLLLVSKILTTRQLMALTSLRVMHN